MGEGIVGGRGSSKVIDIAITLVAMAMVVYHLISTQYLLLGPIEHQNTHLGFSLILVFLSSLKKSRRLWPLTLAFLLCAVLAVTYIQVFYIDLENRMEFPMVWDLVIGALLIVAVLEGTRRALGLVLTAVALFFIAYALFGQYLPRPFGIFPISVTQLVYELSTGFTGIYGVVLSVSANYIFLFVLLGGILKVAGGPRFFREIGLVVGRMLKGGPAMTAVVGSSLVGSVTGAPSANIAITGSFTIPLMKQSGYRPEQAGAIEAAASTGGQIMPPVMSAAAFLMAGITGISYARVMLAALLPAILYYISIGLYVQLQAMKMNLRPLSGERANLREILLSAPSFIVPLIVIIVLFVIGYTPMYVGFWAVVTSFALGLVRKETRPSLTQWVEGFTSGAVMGAAIGVSCAAIGVMVKVLTMTGLGIRLPAIVEAWSGGNLFLALIMVMFASLILGCGVPTAPAYIMVAIAGAPVLLKLGLTVLQAHFFVFYFAVMSMLTPPVAPAAVVSSSLARTSFMKTAIEEIKPAIAGFLVPFMIIWCPILIMEPQASLLLGLLRLLALIIAIICIQVGINDHYFVPCRPFERVSSFLSAALLFLGAPFQSYALFTSCGLGAAIFIFLTVNQVRRRKIAAEAPLRPEIKNPSPSL
ncbi:MAG: TRAP transporter fused permease subunit [Deltaproteobacteria bacterium]|nr:MAG: TRAP transporter fused permease subunit [Deltaproteobacteria bacterium]